MHENGKQPVFSGSYPRRVHDPAVAWRAFNHRTRVEARSYRAWSHMRQWPPRWERSHVATSEGPNEEVNTPRTKPGGPQVLSALSVDSVHTSFGRTNTDAISTTGCTDGSIRRKSSAGFPKSHVDTTTTGHEEVSIQQGPPEHHRKGHQMTTHPASGAPTRQDADPAPPPKLNRPHPAGRHHPGQQIGGTSQAL